ncbi:hypothetical protein GCM10007036_03090 [Alsobacter metallidurans]|uniref:Uncharacterized protein n=1 Tax=Alsobacter metallidurans TaxID=340221 RepID=A0A917I364_9HYPH|nr:hypothetical protein [Alsobacter metallidurans]GGH07897.1 hypothetical protein GCM10007036_03090 [Alsobacter metallidurans]
MTDLSHAAPRRSAEGLLGNGAVMVLFCWALAAAMRFGSVDHVGIRFNDTDDASRLSQVRDLLNGQGWFDLVQHRLDPAFPVPMHWSRLVDAPIAILILFCERFTDVAAAERLAMTVWPLIVLLAAMAAVWSVAVRIGGVLAGAPAVLLLAFGLSVLWQFDPGRIDHHNVQVVLSLLMFAAVFGQSRRAGALAGLICALMLAIGLETILLLASASLAAVYRCLMEPQSRTWARAFGTSLAAGGIGLMLTTVPPALWQVGVCDSLSANYAALAVLGGGGLALVASADLRHRRMWMGGVAAVSVVVFGWIEPACLRGPFGQVDPRLWPIWLDHVEEMKSVWKALGPDLTSITAMLSGPVLALGASLFLLRLPEMRRSPAYWAYVASFSASFAIGCFQIRTLFYANMLAIPLIAAAIALVCRMAADTGRSAILVLVAAVLATNNSSVVLAAVSLLPQAPAKAVATQSDERSRACMDLREYAGLAREPAALVLSTLDMGPFILAASPHAVMSAPYHRQATGILDGHRILAAAPDEAFALLKARGISLVALCSRSPHNALYASMAPNGLQSRLTRGEAVDGLQPLETRGVVRVFRVAAP